MCLTVYSRKRASLVCYHLSLGVMQSSESPYMLMMSLSSSDRLKKK
uniref:Uncharacterized protein n=1 Tax=Arundo donax TaxID=35708 RepID=A0A0A8Y8M6_ARUDO